MCTAGQRVSLTITGPGPSFTSLSYSFTLSPLPPSLPPSTGDFGGVHGVGQILFVGEDEEDGFAELVFIQHPVEFLASFSDSLPIVAVDHEDQTLPKHSLFL